jgi:hypothetical protein
MGTVREDQLEHFGPCRGLARNGEPLKFPGNLRAVHGRHNRPGRSGRCVPIRPCVAAVARLRRAIAAFAGFWIKRLRGRTRKGRSGQYAAGPAGSYGSRRLPGCGAVTDADPPGSSRRSVAATPEATSGPCGCRKPRPRHATWAYSWISPPRRSSRMTCTPAAGAASGTVPSGDAWPSERCGRCSL